MGKVERARLEAELARRYAAGREPTAPEVVDGLVSMMTAEDARAGAAGAVDARASAAGARASTVDARASAAGAAGGKAALGCGPVGDTRPRGMKPAAFVAAQVRYIPAWTWIAQVALVALMGALAHAAGNAPATKAAVGMLAAASVLAGMPAVHASKRHRLAELEYACPHNAASVMVARLIVMGCASALAVGLMVAAAASSIDADAFVVALWAAPPFFCSCAGMLALLRKAAPSSATAMGVVWVCACSTTLLAMAAVYPQAYGVTSLAIWAAAAACALAWLAREVAMTLRAVTDGLDAFSPHMANTYN